MKRVFLKNEVLYVLLKVDQHLMLNELNNEDLAVK